MPSTTTHHTAWVDVIQMEGETIAETIARGRREHPNSMRLVIPARPANRWRAAAIAQAA